MFSLVLNFVDTKQLGIRSTYIITLLMSFVASSFSANINI
jgi:hypothetical protein